MTSIEFLIEQLWAPCRGIPSHIIEEAKEMHKQEIMDAYIDRMDCTSKEEMRRILGEQYYQETFKK